MNNAAHIARLLFCIERDKFNDVSPERCIDFKKREKEFKTFKL